MVTVGPYNVNTMTLTATSGYDRINLAELCSEAVSSISADDAGRGSIIHVSYRDGKNLVRRGTVTKRNGKLRRYGKRMFDNQATVVVSTPGPHGPVNVNIKVFRNGNIQMTGARSVEHGRAAANVALGSSYGGRVSRVEVQLMNCNFKVSKRVRRDALHSIAKSKYRMISSFNPDIYPAVKIYYMYNRQGDGRCHCCTSGETCIGTVGARCKRVTILVFSGKSTKTSSSAIITGGVNSAQVDAAHSWLSSVLVENAKDLFYDAPA